MSSPELDVIGAPVRDLDTPCLVLDLDKVERNLDAMDAAFAGSPVRLRPHSKTHKSPRLALMQLQRGAIGICCAKLGEAEVMAAGGVAPLLITTELVGAAKIRRLLGLARQVDVMTVVDDADAAERISEAALAEGLRIPCLVDVNVGSNRTGVEPGEPAVTLALRVAAMKGLAFRGLQGYEGHAQHVVDYEQRRASHAAAMTLLAETADRLTECGLDVAIVSAAGTGTCQFAREQRRVTEVQPGSYLVMDADYGAIGGLQFEYALTLLATVISRRGNVAIVDAGIKALSVDTGPAVPLDLDATYDHRGDEHGALTFTSGNPLSIGDKVSLIPNHCDPTINLHDVYYVTRGDRVVAVWPIAARGRLQ